MIPWHIQTRLEDALRSIRVRRIELRMKEQPEPSNEVELHWQDVPEMKLLGRTNMACYGSG